MSLNVSLLEESFESIKPVASQFSADFYNTLFADYPNVQPLFANSHMSEQQEKLVSALVMVIQNLQNPDLLGSSLRGLGTRHVQYGVLPEHYPMVGASLLKTLDTYLGSQWTPKVQQAWLDAYKAIATIMLEGAENSEKALAIEV